MIYAGVSMCCVAGSPSGRIFLGGLDGHLHELCYAGSASMFSRRCYQVGSCRVISQSHV